VAALAWLLRRPVEGKTTLLATWIASLSSELLSTNLAQNTKLITQNSLVAWLTLDDNDTDVALVLPNIIAALSTTLSLWA